MSVVQQVSMNRYAWQLKLQLPPSAIKNLLLASKKEQAIVLLYGHVNPDAVMHIEV